MNIKSALKYLISLILALALSLIVLVIGATIILIPVVYLLWPEPQVTPLPPPTSPVPTLSRMTPTAILLPGESRLPSGEGAAWQFDAPSDSTLRLWIDARIEYNKLAGSAPVLELLVNGEPVMEMHLVNKAPEFQFQDSRTSFYFSPSGPERRYNLWVLFYSPDFEANIQPGSGYQVLTGEPYRYAFDITPLLQPGRKNMIHLTNHSEEASKKLGRPLAIIYRSLLVIEAKSGARLELTPVNLTATPEP